MIENGFTKALEFRHACKIFDENKKIDEPPKKVRLPFDEVVEFIE